MYLGTILGDPQPYLLLVADHHHAIPLTLVEQLAVGPSPFRKRPPPTPSNGRPPDEPTHATRGPKRAIALLTLKAEATIPRELEGINHLMVGGLTEHVLIAAMYAAASACRVWEDRPSPLPAQGAQDAPDNGPYRRGHPPNRQHASTPEDPPPGRPPPARQLGRNGRPPGHHRRTHPVTPGRLVDSGMGRPRQGQTGNGTRSR